MVAERERKRYVSPCMQDRPDRHNSPLPPIQLPKVAIPSYLHPISTRSWRNEKEGGCWQPADLPMHRGAVPREGCFATLVGFPGHSPPSYLSPNRIFPLTHAHQIDPLCRGPAAGLTYARRRGVAGPPGRPGFDEAEKGWPTTNDDLSALSGPTSIHPSIHCHPSPDPISPGGESPPIV